jgi:hypothetical protein
MAMKNGITAVVIVFMAHKNRMTRLKKPMSAHSSSIMTAMIDDYGARIADDGAQVADHGVHERDHGRQEADYGALFCVHGRIDRP